ncbi:hypothetical protein [Okeania sp. SIO2B3]|uniref:hypothetical protein n=1 Tax=Okeania sp. SIO2B3 TaxID=2607784 RepID=UPI0013BFC193|nr:hypothetical protein [Okeania sp. SIO2B3]NET44858.1 hypothetical protein [Okeania sp. SIO2B3]
MTSANETKNELAKFRLSVQKDSLKLQVKSLEKQLGVLHLALDSIALEEENLEKKGDYSLSSLPLTLLNELSRITSEIDFSLSCFVILKEIDLTSIPFRITILSGEDQVLAFLCIDINQLDCTDAKFHIEWESDEFKESRSGKILAEKINSLNK